MAFRKFIDRDGQEWEVRIRSKTEWDLEPVGGNPQRARTAPAPGYEKDPFELSREELQHLLDSSAAPPSRSTKSPFKD
jgi:hypothetical protein